MATPPTKKPSRYADDFVAVYYDMNYKPHAKGHLSKWLIVRYEDDTIIDFHMDYLVGQSMEPAAAERARQDVFVGRGGDREFPAKMNSSTMPRMWAARQEVLKAMDDYTTMQILQIFPTLFFILTVGTPAVGTGAAFSVVRRPVPEGSVSRLVTSRIHRPISKLTRRSHPSPETDWDAWEAWNRAHSDYGKRGTDVTGAVRLPDPPEPLPVYHHGLNKGGLQDILTHQRLISTPARGIAGGSDGVRAISGPVPTPYSNSGTYIEFVTSARGNPTRFMGGRPGAQWAIPEGTYLEIRIIRVIENGKVTFEDPSLFFHYLKGG